MISDSGLGPVVRLETCGFQSLGRALPNRLRGIGLFVERGFATVSSWGMLDGFCPSQRGLEPEKGEQNQALRLVIRLLLFRRY